MTFTLEVQSRIVERIEAERKDIDGCGELIKTYEEKIKRLIDKVWGGMKTVTSVGAMPYSVTDCYYTMKGR